MKSGKIHIAAVLLALVIVAVFALPAWADDEITCEIVGGTQYESLADALADANDGETVRLLADISYNNGLDFVDKDITFDLNEYILNVNSPDDGIFANNSVIGIIGAGDRGALNVTGTTRGVRAVNNASVTVTNANAESDLGAGVFAESGAEVTVQGNATATGANSIGAWTEGGSITVMGNVQGTGCGAVCYGAGNSVTIGGDAIATGAGGTGAVAGNGGYITISGDAIATGAGGIGAEAENGGVIIIDGNVSSVYEGIVAIGGDTEIEVEGNVTVEANGTWGIQALTDDDGGAIVLIEGNVTVNGAGGVLGGGVFVEGNGGSIDIEDPINRDDSIVHVRGSVTTTEGVGVKAEFGGDAIVDGNVQASSAEGVYAEDAGSTVRVNTNLSGATGVCALEGGMVEVLGGVGAVTLGVQAGFDDSLVFIRGGVIVSDDAGIGAEAYGASESGEAVIRINGSITANTYIRVGGEIKNGSEASRTIPTLWPGYYTYSNGGNIVYVKEPEFEGGPPAVVTDTATGITASGATLRGNVTNDGGIEVYERGFVYSLATGPEIGAEGVNVVMVGSGTGGFSTNITGLTPDTIYHVRAYATNEAGTSYGEDRMFTTHSASLPSGPDDDDLPTVFTGPVTGITASDATLSGKVTSSGGATVTERGFVYSTSAYPAIGGSDVTKVTTDGGLGEFTAEITGLVPGTAYHVRAYAINREGTAYGANVGFTTEPIPPVGETGWLDAPATGLTSGNVVLYTNPSGEEFILGLSIVEGSVMKYISRGPGEYEIIYNAKPFDDILGHWAKNDIDFNTARLLFIGVTPRLFSPDTAMTRGMFAAVLGRMYGADPSLYTGHIFNDVPESAYYAPYVKWARENGILFGVSESLFEPERAVTRQEMAALMHRFMKFLGLNLENGGEEFSDADAIDSWARESVMSLRETGILNGKPGNLFDPDASSTRAEITSVLRRLIEYIVNK